MAPQSPNLSEKVHFWLNGLGFSVGNPFATVEAEQERDLLPRFFVGVPEIDELEEVNSIIIFAPRGGGKSALRVMLADKTAPRNTDHTTLSVEFTDFDGLLSSYQQKSLNSDAAVRALIEAGVETLCSFLLHRGGDVSEIAKIGLSEFLHTYTPFLLTPRALLQRLNRVSPDVLSKLGMTWGEFKHRVEEGRLAQVVQQWGEGADIRLLADLNDFSRGVTAVSSRPVPQLEAFYRLCQEVGLTAVFFLIDRVDELPDTANNPELQAQLLAPFIGHLLLMEMGGVALKFFLPNMVRAEIEAQGWLRLDRVHVKTSQLEWSGPRLLQLLNQRMGVFSRQQVTDLGQICQDKVVAEEIERWVETAVSPRQLLRAMQKLCTAHVAHAGTTGLLTMADWKAVEGELPGEGKTAVSESSKAQKDEPLFAPDGTPLLRLDINRHLAWLGKEPMKFTITEFKVLGALAGRRNGRCKRDDLAEKVWETKDGVSDQTIDRNISRIREKLHDTEKGSWIYLDTIRGWGFQLKNYNLLT